MAKKVLCIEVGQRYTRICEMMGYKTTPVIYNCITFQTPQSTFEDGYIRDKGVLGAAIRKQLVEHKIRTTDTIFTVNSTKIANREVSIPYVKESKIKSIVELQASDHFPIDISDYNVSYYILSKGEKVKNQERKIKLLLLAAPNNLIQSYYNLAAAAGLQVEAIDYIGNSFYQVVKRQLNQGVNISIHINDNTSLVNIIENDSLLLQRIIPYGANDIIERVLHNEAFHVKTEDEAIRLLQKEKLINVQFEAQKEEDITYMSISEGLDQVKRELKAKDDVTESLRFLVNNIIRVLDYFTAKNADKKMGYVYVSGLGAKFQGILQLFKNELGFETKKIDSVYIATFSKKIDISNVEQAEYIACIGAGIAPVNFGVKQRGVLQNVKKTDIKTWKNACAFVTVLSVVFLGTMLFVKIQAITRQNSLKSSIDALEGVEAIYNDYDEAKSKFNNLNKMNEKTLSKLDKLDIILADLEKKLPKKVSITNLTVNQENVLIDVEGSGPLAISKLLINFGDIPYLTDFVVDSYSNSSSEGNIGVQTITFKVSARFSGTEVGAKLDSSQAEDNGVANEANESDNN